MTFWQATNAKAKFSEVLDKAETQGPQRIERRKKRFILVTEEQYAMHGNLAHDAKSKPFVSAWDALAPSAGATFADADFPRMRGKMREGILG